MACRFFASVVLLAALGTAVAAPPTGWDQELLKRYPSAKAHDKARDATIKEMRVDLDRRRAALATAEEARKDFLDTYEPYDNRPPSATV